MFLDQELRTKVRITSANSINILRWIPQSFYYFYGWSLWRQRCGDGKTPDIVVPSGNYGNITSGMLAWKMGLPVRRFLAGANANDVVPKFLLTGEYCPGPSVQTVANAMDVGAPSNFERMMYLLNRDFGKVTSMVEGRSWSDGQIRKGISELFEKYGYLSDPHSAVGYLTYRDCNAEGWWVSTAHAAKFGTVISESIGQKPELPERFREILAKPRFHQSMEAEADALRSILLG